VNEASLNREDNDKNIDNNNKLYHHQNKNVDDNKLDDHNVEKLSTNKQKNVETPNNHQNDDNNNNNVLDKIKSSVSGELNDKKNEKKDTTNVEDLVKRVAYDLLQDAQMNNIIATTNQDAVKTLNDQSSTNSNSAETQQHSTESINPLPFQKEEEVYDAEIENDYTIGMSKLNTTREEKEYRAAYFYLNRAASKGHTRAREEVAIALMFGDYLTRNLTAAREIFDDISLHRGSPRSQFYLGFIYAAGLGIKSSQSKAITYFTFAALGGDSMAQMTLGYRYSSGISVVNSCEMALNFYSKVAASVAGKISTNSVGAVVHRIRLYDEEEKISGQNQAMLDDDLVQYYQLLADRGDIQAQYGLGLLHYQGARGLSIQYDKALHYFKKAADAGNNYAMAYLGKLYFEGGATIKQDNVTALRFFKMAADKGNPIGQAGMGLM
jgi:SEL1 protein